MMGRQTGDQSQLFYLFNLEELIPASHLLRRINPVVTRVLAELRENLTPLQRCAAPVCPAILHRHRDDIITSVLLRLDTALAGIEGANRKIFADLRADGRWLRTSADAHRDHARD